MNLLAVLLCLISIPAFSAKLQVVPVAQLPVGNMAHIQRALARAMSMQGLYDDGPVNNQARLQDDYRMIRNIKPKFIGRWAGWWGTTWDSVTDQDHYSQVKNIADAIHGIDSDIVLEAAVFEYVNRSVNNFRIPAWVFEEFNLPVVNRNFNMFEMVYSDYPGNADHGSDEGPVPDMSRLETKMWYFYRAHNYIDAGAEALHLGQFNLMDDNDPDHLHWWEIMTRIRNYGNASARRKFVWLNTHASGYVTPTNGFRRLIFDFHEFPLRPKQRGKEIQQATLEKNYLDTIFHINFSGITPRNEYVQALPYLIEFDNYGISDKPGVPNQDWSPFGYDEITWFSLMSTAQRNTFLWYANDRIASFQTNGFLQMPGRRGTTRPNVPWPGVIYRANTGVFDQENDIKAIWDNPPARQSKITLSMSQVCPIGTFDGANCYVASSPTGSSPFIFQNRFYYSPIKKSCPVGSFDGTNCYVSTPPADAIPFIYNNGFYYGPLKKSCPQGSFDGVNCRISSVPPGGSGPFMYQGRFYYKPILKTCPTGSFDGVNCFFANSPTSSKPFIYNNSFYHEPLLAKTYCQQNPGASTRCCPSGSFDGANCRVGSPPIGKRAFIYQSNFYYEPVAVPQSSCSGTGPCCPVGSFDGANCYAGTPTGGTTGFIYNNSFYTSAQNLNCSTERIKCCPTGAFDGANCSVGSPPNGLQAFLYQKKYYYTPQASGPQCPTGTFDGSNCQMAQQPVNGGEAFIYQGKFYVKAKLVL